MLNELNCGYGTMNTTEELKKTITKCIKGKYSRDKKSSNEERRKLITKFLFKIDGKRSTTIEQEIMN